MQNIANGVSFICFRMATIMVMEKCPLFEFFHSIRRHLINIRRYLIKTQ